MNDSLGILPNAGVRAVAQTCAFSARSRMASELELITMTWQREQTESVVPFLFVRCMNAGEDCTDVVIGISELRLCCSFGVKQAKHIQTGTDMSFLEPAKVGLLRIGCNNSLAFSADGTDGAICFEVMKKQGSGGVGQNVLVSCSHSVGERFTFGCHFRAGGRGQIR